MFFSNKNGPVFNINGACKAIDVDTRRDVVIKTWKTSANKIRLFLFPKNELHSIFSSANTVQLALGK